MNEDREQTRNMIETARKRERNVRDAAGLIGLACVAVGTGLMSVPWALIVCGAVLMGLSIWGSVRSDHSAARNPQ